MASVGTAFAEILPDTSRFGSEAERGIKGEEGRFHSIGKNLGLAIAAGVAIATAAIGSQIGKSIESASNLAESQSKVTAVFKDQSGVINKWAEDSATKFGTSKQAALEAAGSYGNLFQAFGLGQNDAAKMSTSLVELATDLASFNNTSVDDALIALQSGLSGETEPLKRYGVSINENTLKLKAMQLGIVKTTVDQKKLSTVNEKVDKATRKQAEALKKYGKDSVQFTDATRDLGQAQADLGEVLGGKMPAQLTAAQKAQASYALIMEQTTIAQGDFARTSGGLANQERILQAQMENLRAEIGGKLLPAKLELYKALNNKVIPAVSDLAVKAADLYVQFKGLVESKITGWFDDVAGYVTPLASKLSTMVRTDVARWFNDIGTGVSAMATAFKTGQVSGTLDGIAGTLERIGPRARELFNLLDQNQGLVLAVAAGLTAFAGSLVAIHQGQAALSALGTVGSILVPLGPWGLLAAAVIGVGVAAFLAYKKFKPFRDFVDSSIATIKSIAIPAFKAVSSAISSAFAAVAGIAPKITTALAPVGKALSGAWDAVVKNLGPIKAWLDDNVISTFQAAGEFMVAFGRRFGQVLKAMWQVAKPILKFIGDLITGFVTTVLPIFSAAWDGILVPVKIVFSGIKAIVETVLGQIRGVFQIFTGILNGDWSKIWEGLKAIVVTPLTATWKFIVDTFDTIVGYLRGVPSRLVEIFTGIWDGIWTQLVGVKDLVVGEFNTVADWFKDVPAKVAQAAVDMWGGITGGFDTAKLWVIGELAKVGEWFAGVAMRVVEATGTMFSGVGAAFIKAKNWVLDELGAVGGWFLGLPGKIADAASGMWDGISDAFKSAINKIIEVWNSIDLSIDVDLPDWIPFAGGKGFHSGDIFPDVSKLATGGVITSPTLALMGETARARPEIVAPQPILIDSVLTALRRFEPSMAVAGAGGSAEHFHLHIDSPGDLSGEQQIEYGVRRLGWESRVRTAQGRR